MGTACRSLSWWFGVSVFAIRRQHAVVIAKVCESGLLYGPLRPEQRCSNPTRGCELREIKPQMSFKALKSCIKRNGIHRYHVTGDSASTLGGFPSNIGCEAGTKTTHQHRQKDISTIIESRNMYNQCLLRGDSNLERTI
jgi:hypothetical protein